MSTLESAPADTHLSPVLFADGSDRRRSARIPLSAPVKVGPPQGLPTSPVSATDLSVNGLFIDADRPVRVGARFSAEIPLSSGKRIYVSEAEVAYNRDRVRGAGFGVRFVDLDAEAAAAIAEEVARLTRPGTSSVVDLPPPLSEVSGVDDEESILPTLAPRPAPKAHPLEAPVLEVDVSRYPEPVILREAFDDELELPELMKDELRGEKAIQTERIRRRTVLDGFARARRELTERAHRAPQLWGWLLGAGAAAVVASVALTLFGRGPTEVVDAQPGTERVSSVTHEVLMGSRGPVAVVPPPAAPKAAEPAAEVAPKKPLPPLVVVEEEALEAEAVAAPAEPAPSAAAPKAAAEKPAPAKPAPAKPAPAPVAAPTKPAPAPAVKPAVTAGGGIAKVSLAVAPGATVLRTHVLREPDRFVIDLEGQAQDLALPAPSGMVKSIRSGRHPSHLRVVIDTAQPLEAGQVSKQGGTLVVTLHAKR